MPAPIIFFEFRVLFEQEVRTNLFFIGNPSGGKITGNPLSFFAFKKGKK